MSRGSLVVGVDGSTGSDAAVRWAAGEAAARGLLLRIVHAVAASGPPVLGAAGSIVPDWERSAVGLTEAAAAVALGHRPAVPIEARVVAGEQPATVLARAGDTAEMLVLGATGRGAVGRALLGSTAVNAVRSVRRPVVVVREPASDVEPASAAGMRSLEAANEVDWFVLRERAAVTLAAKLIDHRRDHPSVAASERVAEATPADALIDASRGADLLVVGSRGRSALAGLALGSVSTAVLHRAYCPVAVVRPA